MARKQAPLRPSQLTSLGERLLHLQGLLAFNSVNEFSEFLMVNTGTIQRLITRNPNNTAIISTEMLFRIVQRVPEVNMNWLLTGKGVPLVDHDAYYALHNYYYYKEKLDEVMQRLTDIQNELGAAMAETKLPSSFAKFWEKRLKEMASEVKPPNVNSDIRLGSTERILVREMLDNKAYIRERGGTYHIMAKGVKLRNLRYEMVEKLLDKTIIVKSEKKEGTYTFNPKLREQLKYIVQTKF